MKKRLAKLKQIFYVTDHQGNAKNISYDKGDADRFLTILARHNKAGGVFDKMVPEGEWERGEINVTNIKEYQPQ